MLRESREDLSLTQEVAGIGPWQLSLCSGKLVLSRRACSIFGVAERAPMTYERFLDIVHPDDRQHVDLMCKAALRGEDYDIEHRIIAGGEVRCVREKGILEPRDGGLHSGFGTVRDITESRRQQQRIGGERLAPPGHSRQLARGDHLRRQQRQGPHDQQGGGRALQAPHPVRQG